MSKRKTNNYKAFEEKLRQNEKAIAASNKYLNLKDIGLKIELKPNEKFKQCLGTENYWVSNYGQVLRKDSIKYKLCHLCEDKDEHSGKSYYRTTVRGRLDYVHRLVAEVWCDGFDPELRNEVHHKDGNGLNNYYKNLIWVNKAHHSRLDRGIEVYFMSNHVNSDFVLVEDFPAIADKLNLEPKILGAILSKSQPDFKHGTFEIYEFESGGKSPYYIGLDHANETTRKENVIDK